MITGAEVEAVARRMCVHMGVPEDYDGKSPRWWRSFAEEALIAIAAHRAIADVNGKGDE